jgi:hypothetical protein
MSAVLQSFQEEVANDKVLIIAPKFGMTFGAQFGLHRIVAVLELPSRSAIDPSRIPSNVKLLGTITPYTIPGGWEPLWMEGDCAVFRRGSLAAGH